MSRKIRRVPANWEHPKAERGDGFQPLYDEDFHDASWKWWEAAVRWHNASHGTRCLEEHEMAAIDDHPWYWQWDGPPPDQDYYRQPSTAERTHYQMYETVSEGTPVSPVFASLQELEDWLVADGYWDVFDGREAISGESRAGTFRKHPASRDDPGYHSEKCSREAAKAFCAQGWAFSGVMNSDGYHANLEGSAVLARAKAKNLDSGDGA